MNNFWLAVLTSLSVGALVGLANGFFITKARLRPFVVTLATMSMVQGFYLHFLERQGHRNWGINSLGGDCGHCSPVPGLEPHPWPVRR